MFNFIKADIFRIFHNKKLWIYFAGLIILATIGLAFSANRAVLKDNPESFVQIITICIGISQFIIGIPLLLTVYDDDLKSKSLQFIFTSRINKIQFVVSKFVTSIFITTIVYLAFLIYTYILSLTLFSSLFTLSTNDWKTLVASGLFYICYILIFFSLSSTIAYITQNATVGIIFYILALGGLFTQLLNLLAMPLKFLKPIIDYTPSSLLTKIEGQISGHHAIDIKLIVYLMLYIVAASIISSVFLSKTEIKTA